MPHCVHGSESLPELVRSKLASDFELRPFPVVVEKLVTALKDPDVRPDTISSILESDAALASRILRMANSPMFGISRTIELVSQATVILGHAQVKSIAMAFAGAAMFEEGNTETLHVRRQLWQHSFRCAVAARAIAGELKLGQEHAFLAGIFHDIGKLFFLDVAPEVYTQIVMTAEDPIAAEREKFGITHPEVGVKLSAGWRLPAGSMSAIGYHHQPDQGTGSVDLIEIVNIANRLAHLVELDKREPALVEFIAEAKVVLGLSATTLLEIQDLLQEQVW